MKSLSILSDDNIENMISEKPPWTTFKEILIIYKENSEYANQ